MYYTLIIQHTVSKQVYSYLLEDLAPESMYIKFHLVLDEGTEDGEYQYVLVENPDEADVEINVNDIFKSTINGNQITIADNGLLRVGDYKETDITYNKEQEYICYGG